MKGYIAKMEGLRGAMRGEAVISPVLAGRMLEEFRRLSQFAPQEAADDELATLTSREKEILSHVALGRSDKEIATMLSISLHTVKSHLRNILARKKGLV
jgi:DNA-binding NarL/FixJ family response regulator